MLSPGLTIECSFYLINVGLVAKLLQEGFMIVFSHRIGSVLTRPPD
jgi:hypothetical protein